MFTVLYVSERPLCSQIGRLNWQKLLLNGGICHYDRDVQEWSINSNSEHANGIFTHEVQFDFLHSFIRCIFLVFQA